MPISPNEIRFHRDWNATSSPMTCRLRTSLIDFHFSFGRHDLSPISRVRFKIRAANRFGESGFDLWAAAERHDDHSRIVNEVPPFAMPTALRSFESRGDSTMGPRTYRRNHSDRSEPGSAVIDYEKGCYIGQEVISRMKMSGQTNKRLCGVVGAGRRAGNED